MRRRVFATTVTVLIVVVAITAVTYPRHGKADNAPRPTAVWLKSPVVGDLIESVNAPGEVEPLSKVTISAKVSARIVALPYQEGQVVTKGDPDASPSIPASVLVRLDASDPEAALRSADAHRAAQAAQIEVETNTVASRQADLKAVEASLLQAKQDLERTGCLYDQGIASRGECDMAKNSHDEAEARRASSEHALEAAQANLQVVRHNLDAADAEVAQAREALSYTTITSPINGVVTRVNGSVGELAVTGTMNTPGTAIMEVSDLSQMRVVVRVDETSVGKITVGQHAAVRIHTYPDDQFTGVVESIGLTPDVTADGVKYFKTKILLEPNKRRVCAGLTADVDIETQQYKDVLKVPSEAIMARPTESLPKEMWDSAPSARGLSTVVFCLVSGKALITPVSVGGSDADDTAVLSGINKDDTVIVGPYKALDALENGQYVVGTSRSGEK